MTVDAPQSAESIRAQLASLQKVVFRCAGEYCRARRGGEPAWAVNGEKRFLKHLFRRREILKHELRKAEAREHELGR